MASRTMAFDLATRTWSDHVLQALGLSPGLFSRAVPSGTVVGELSAGVAQVTGLPTGLRLVAGGHDQCCAAVGAGAINPALGVVSSGTAEVLATALAAPALSARMFESYYPCYLHAAAGRYFTFALNHTGGILLRWHRDTFAHAEVAAATAQGRDPYAVIDDLLPAGLSPVMVLPHFNGSGTPTCDLTSKGAIVGLTLATTRHDIAKAILEALCFELRLNLRVMQDIGIQVDELVAVGGGARSPRWLQLKADILGRPVRTPQCSDAACLGAALLAGLGAGVYASFDEAVAAAVRTDREFRPDAALREAYGARFELYQKLHPALRVVHPHL
jgi:xylulokinase